MKKTTVIAILIGLIIVALYRVWFPIDNFNPIGAMALMGGALIGHKYLRFLLPLGALFIGDVLMTQFSEAHSTYLFSTTFIAVYVAFGLIIGLGYLFRNRLSYINVIGASLLAAVAFFAVSNFGSWIELPYPKNFAGLTEAFAAGIPFFRNTLISQLVFSLAVYAVYQYSSAKQKALA